MSSGLKPCYGCKDFLKIDSFDLGVILGHKPRFIPNNIFWHIQLIPKDPFSINSWSIMSPRNKMSNMVALILIKLFLYDKQQAPIWVALGFEDVL